jgi:hypothetical protein
MYVLASRASSSRARNRAADDFLEADACDRDIRMAEKMSRVGVKGERTDLM